MKNSVFGNSWGSFALRLVLMLTMFFPSWALAQAPSASSPPPSSSAPADEADRQWRGHVLLEMSRVKTIRAQCLEEGLRAEAARQAAVANSKIAEGAAFARFAGQKARCVEDADAELLKLEGQLAAGRASLLAGEQKFRADYERGLRTLLTGLQQLTTQLRTGETSTLEAFSARMTKFGQDLDRFRNHYIRLVNDPSSQPLAARLFKASDLLVASAKTWKREVDAEREMSRGVASGSERFFKARSVRDAAAVERAAQWATAQRLVQEAATLAPAK